MADVTKHEVNIVDDNEESFSDSDDCASPLNLTLREALHTSATSDPGVSLLREIFPDKSDEELRQLHSDRLENSAKTRGSPTPAPFTSKLGQRIWNLCQEDDPQRIFPQVSLPADFLVFPDIERDRNQWQDQLMSQLQQRVLQQHRQHQETRGRVNSYPLDEEYCYSRALSRDSVLGLGMTLCEESGSIWIHSLVGDNGMRWFWPPPSTETGGPALRAGIRPGDWLLGIQGQALLPTDHNQFLRYAVSSVQSADNPVILHLQHVSLNGLHPLAGCGPSLLDTTIESLDTSLSEDTVSTAAVSSNGHTVRRIHPFASALASKGLIRSKRDAEKASKQFAQFTERARHWESTSSFRIDATTYQLRHHFDPTDLPPSESADLLSYDGETASNLLPYARSTPMLDPAIDPMPIEYFDNDGKRRCWEDDLTERNGTAEHLAKGNSQSPSRKQKGYPSARMHSNQQARLFLQPSDILIPLMCVRKALCVRILNTFVEENRTAYTIWVYDVESGREWYAPIRYLRDFHELRSATAPLCPSISQIPFPSSGWLMFGVSEKSEPDSVRNEKCHQLENFLRTLCALIYTGRLTPDIAEIYIHVQSFLGCERALTNGDSPAGYLHTHGVENEPSCACKVEDGHNTFQLSVRLLLKRAIQQYTYRLFLLDAMKTIVDDFVNQARSHGPTLREIEYLQAKGHSVLKDRAMQDLGRIQDFLDRIQALILLGCTNDFESIAKRRDFFALQNFLVGKNGDVYLDKIVRDAVREQIEIEIYVPLRSVVSRLLVNGWRHDDMEIHFKMQVLKKSPQSIFKIPEWSQSSSGWRSVSTILNEGVGMSTLPCAKLRAIVDAAKEIIRVYSEERGHKVDGKNDCPEQTTSGVDAGETEAVRLSTLGADDFLPIFIYTVVRAEMERPCALCILLQTLCDSTSRIGETGYYLASFEGAITHIKDLDLTTDKELTF